MSIIAQVDGSGTAVMLPPGFTTKSATPKSDVVTTWPVMVPPVDRTVGHINIDSAGKWTSRASTAGGGNRYE